ncbi:MAG: FkbM family methyltransferase [Anaerolineae bacterium]|nr:MAG: FkbM family methyltransferase [Anaerolineae bacterium]
MSFAEFIYTEILKPRPLKALTNAILLRILPESVRIGAAHLYLDPDDPVVSGALTLHVFEPSELRFFQRYCRGRMTLVDIGANIGLYTALAIHNLDAGSRIIALEPHPVTYTFLQRNIRLNLDLRGEAGPRVDAFPLAATPEPSRKELRLNPENRGDNRLYHGTYKGKVENWEAIPVEGKPVDDVLEQLGIHEVNFVKIDIQGYEQMALTGFQRTLKRSERVILMSEFWPKGLKEAGGDARAYLELLTHLGFTLYELHEHPRGRITPLGDWDRLIARLPGRRYTNIVGVKGYAIE